jgi:flagellar hook-length control protein FliK
MNLPPAEALGPINVMDASASKGAGVRDLPVRGESFERLLGKPPSRPSRPAVNRCADENGECELSATNSGETNDAEATAGLVAQETGETGSDASEVQPTDEQDALAAVVAIAPAIPLPELTEIAVAADLTAEQSLVEADEEVSASVGIMKIAETSDLTMAVTAIEQAVDSAADASSAEHRSESQAGVAADIAPQPTELEELGDVVAADQRDGSGDRPESGDRDGKQDSKLVDLLSGASSAIAAADQQAGALSTGHAKPDAPTLAQTDNSQQLATATSQGLPPQPQRFDRLPSEVLVAVSSRPGTTEQSVAIDSARLLQRVARAFAAAHDGGEVRLRLSPPELGALRLDVRVQDGALVARMEAETSAARTALIENLPALRERLAEQGVRIERFDVDLMRRDANGTPDRPADHQPPEQPVPSPVARLRRMPQVAEGVVARTALPSNHDLRRLNVVV